MVKPRRKGNKMAKNSKLVARVRYERDTKGDEYYRAEISTDGGKTFGLDTAYKFNGDYLNFGIVKWVLRCLELGYDVIPYVRDYSNTQD